MKSPELSPLSPNTQVERAVKLREAMDELGIIELVDSLEPSHLVEGTVFAQPENKVNRHDSIFTGVKLDPQHKEALLLAFKHSEHDHLVSTPVLMDYSSYLGVRIIKEICDKGVTVNGVDFAVFDENGEFLDYLLINRLNPVGNGRKGMFIFGETVAPRDMNLGYYLLDAMAGTLETSQTIDEEFAPAIASSWLHYQNNPHLNIESRLEISNVTSWVNEELFGDDIN